MHVDVSGAEEGEVVVPHIELEAREIGVSFRKVACVCMPKHVLHTMPLESRIIPDFTPAVLPVHRANRRMGFGLVDNQKAV